MDIRFDDKVVIVTGASSGIGKATALEFAKSGARVIVHYNTNKSSADEVVEQIKEMDAEAVSIGGDLTISKNVDLLIQKTLNSFGTIDILINNAGSLVERQSIESMDNELWERVMDVNLTSVYLCSKAVIPTMKEKGYGRIINLTSVAARNGGGPGAGHYSTAKAGVLTFSKSLAKELASTGILVNAVSPGVITTPYHDRFSTPEARKMYANNTPLKREGTAEEVTYGILFLASGFASFILGETMEINGGLLLD